MIKRASPVDQIQAQAQLASLVEMIESALDLASDLEQHRIAAALDDALIHAQRAAGIAI